AEPLNARVPVMSCPGNHEYASAEAFKSYNARYPMPYAQSGSVDPNYWSRDIGPMHVVALNSYAASGPDSFQFNWLKKDLEAFNRKRTPWLVVMMHAPFYNSNLGHLGEATVMMGDLEELFFKHGVNVVLAGH
ncbi:PAP22, partial [Symbiodinium sp. KB8]